MARSRSRRTRARVDFYNAPGRALRSAQRLRLQPIMPSRVNLLQLVSDRRRWHPDPIRPAVTQSIARPRLAQRYSAKGRLAGIGFADPTKVLICIRRRARRRAMFAFGGAGGSVKRPKWNYYSHVRC